MDEINQKKKQLQGSLQKIEGASEKTLQFVKKELAQWGDESFKD